MRFLQEGLELSAHCIVGGAFRSCLQGDDEVVTLLNFGEDFPRCLTNFPLPVISSCCVFDNVGADDNCDACVRRESFRNRSGQVLCLHALSCAKNTAEIQISAKPVNLREHAYGVICHRPFFRRRWSTLLPPGVLDRFRKPCVRLRFLLFGW